MRGHAAPASASGDARHRGLLPAGRRPRLQMQGVCGGRGVSGVNVGWVSVGSGKVGPNKLLALSS